VYSFLGRLWLHGCSRGLPLSATLTRHPPPSRLTLRTLRPQGLASTYVEATEGVAFVLRFFHSDRVDTAASLCHNASLSCDLLALYQLVVRGSKVIRNGGTISGQGWSRLFTSAPPIQWNLRNVTVAMVGLCFGVRPTPKNRKY
jgi:hypothetical protein